MPITTINSLTSHRSLLKLTAGIMTLLLAGCANLPLTEEKLPTAKNNQGAALPHTILTKVILRQASLDKQLEIRNGGYGSDAAAHPSKANQFYALTDRGPNTNYQGSQGKGKQFLVADYTPRIGLFELQSNGQIIMLKEILLKDKTGKPISGLPNPKKFGGTNEIAYGIAGDIMTLDPKLAFDKVSNPTKTDLYGLDAEGLAVMKDGSFWVSDEYGPHIVHYDANGNEIQRINPFTEDQRNNVSVKGKPIVLPAELSRRRANRGMEGLTITPDQSTLVGIMQSSLDNPDKSGRKTNLTRIVSVNLQTGKVSQYLYQQQKAENSNSGIVALNNHEFYVIERDGGFAMQDTTVQKHVYKVDIADASDLELIKSSGDLRQNADLGLTIDGQTLEQFIAAGDSHWQTLTKMGIRPVAKVLVVDAVKQLNYPHDKLEGLWLRQDGSLGLLNDDDFSVWSTDNQLEQKYLDAEKTIEDGNRLYIVKPTQ